MTDQSKRNILIISLCTIVYIIFFPLRLAFEPLISREWVIPSTEIATLPRLNPGDKAYPLFFGKSLLYMEESGKRADRISDASELSIGIDRYAQRLPNGQVALYSRSGEILATIARSGLPYLNGNTLCIISETGTGLAIYSDNGEYRWNFESDDVITGYCGTAKGDAFISLSDGRIFWFDAQGAIRAIHQAGHGAYHIVYDMLWIESRQELAALVDLQPQSLLLLKPTMKADGSDAHFAQIQDVVITQESRHPLVLQTELKDSFLLLEQPQGLGIISFDGSERRIISLDGSVQRFIGITDAGIIIATAEYDSGASLFGFKPDGRFLFKQRIHGRFEDLAVDQHDRMIVSSGAGLLSVDFYAR